MVDVFSQLLVHTTGRWAGQRFQLRPWQANGIIRPLFGQVQWGGKELDRWVRTYQDLWLELPRRNGKSSLLAGIALVLMVADDEPAAEVFGCALDREQAGKVFDIAERMVDLSPVLSRRLKVYRQSRRIVDEATGSYYGIIAGDAAGNLGHNPHGVVFDEVLTQKSRGLWDAMRNSFGSRDQPMFLAATTAGADPSSLAAAEHEYGLRVLEGRVKDERRLVYIRGAPVEARWDDPQVWRQANPALGDSHGRGRFLSLDALHKDARAALSSPAAQTAFRQFRLNQWVRPISFWLDLGRWDATAGMVVESELAARRCYGGLDLANTRDVTALCWVFPDDQEPQGFDALWRYFLPEGLVPALDARTAGGASAWVRAGWITLTPGDVLDHRAVLQQVDKDAQTFDVVELAFDRWGMAQMMTDLADSGLQVVPFGQGYASMGPAAKELERLMLAGQLRHGGNPVSRWMAGNAVVRSDPAGNIKPDKERSGDKIDGIVALAMALDRAVRHAGPAPRSVYEERGLTVG